jgi:hypothetical protein
MLFLYYSFHHWVISLNSLGAKELLPVDAVRRVRCPQQTGCRR